MKYYIPAHTIPVNYSGYPSSTDVAVLILLF